MIDRILSRSGFGLAIFLMIIFLTFMNSKSLNYMFQGLGQIDGYFSVIGGITFSMFTIIIMRMSERKWLAYTFPFLDALLVFCGFNLPYAGHLLDNPIRFLMSIFLAVFSGLITYTVGQVKADRHDGSKNESEVNQIESKRIIDVLNEKLIESNRIVSELQTKQIESKRIIDDSKRMVDESKKLANEFLPNHILFLNWTNSKRKAENCNGHEAKIKVMAEQIKAGKQITVDDYLKATKS